MQRYDRLSSLGETVWLCNCEVTDDRVLAGLVYIGVAPGATVDLFSADMAKVCTIEIPLEARNHFTPLAITEVGDDIEFKILAMGAADAQAA